MADVLIRDFPAEELRALDEQARQLGLSRVEFLRRQLVQQARRSRRSVAVVDLSWLGGLIEDLADPAVMESAWS